MNPSSILTVNNFPQQPDQALALLSEAARRADWPSLEDSARCLCAVQLLQRAITERDEKIVELNNLLSQVADPEKKVDEVEPIEK